MTMVNSNSGSLLELEAEIIDLEEEILDLETRNRFLTIPKRLVAEAQVYHRKGAAQEVRLTINCARKLLERAKEDLKK
jgi:RNase P/RNase MRP subunit p29